MSDKWMFGTVEDSGDKILGAQYATAASAKTAAKVLWAEIDRRPIFVTNQTRTIRYETMAPEIPPINTRWEWKRVED